MRYVKILFIASLAFIAFSCGSANGKNNCDCPHWSSASTPSTHLELAEAN